MQANELQFGLESTLEDTHNLIRSMVRRFVLLTHEEEGEAYGIAYEGFMLAYHDYRPERGAFTTYLVWRIRERLQEHIYQFKRHKRHEHAVAKKSTYETTFNLYVFLSDLSSDAKFAALLALDMPRWLQRCIADTPYTRKQSGRRTAKDPRENKAARRVIVDYLKGLGWTLGRINDTFDEIGESL
jgi:hypothetical protein